MGGDAIVVKVDPEIADMIPAFLANRRRDVDRLREALAARDLDAVHRLGHTLKGVGGSYGFDGVSEIGARIEDCAKSGDPDGAAAATDRLADYVSRVRVEPASP